MSCFCSIQLLLCGDSLLCFFYFFLCPCFWLCFLQFFLVGADFNQVRLEGPDLTLRQVAWLECEEGGRAGKERGKDEKVRLKSMCKQNYMKRHLLFPPSLPPSLPYLPPYL